MILKGTVQTPPAGLDYVIVLGAHVRSTGPSRALHLSETLGYKNAAGIPAKGDLITQPANLLREFFAVVKDFWLLH